MANKCKLYELGGKGINTGVIYHGSGTWSFMMETSFVRIKQNLEESFLALFLYVFFLIYGKVSSAFFTFAGNLSRWLNVAEILAVGESHLFFFCTK